MLKLEGVIQRLMPYLVVIVPAMTYEELPNGHPSEYMQLPGLTERFVTRRGFEKFIKKVEKSNLTEGVYPGGIQRSVRPDPKTYLALPAPGGLDAGTFFVEPKGKFKEYFK